MKSSYYRRILAGLARLEGPRDHDAFEKCAVALLGDAYPGLASVHGGSDAGMDGAIGDGEGEAYPLVVTTAKDVRRNLRKSLASYVRSGKQRRRAVFATSRRVAPPERRKLEAIARDELGFVLVNVHEQHDFAQRLFKNSAWARELLGITGEPPALSEVPRTNRPLLEIELVGRDADLRWLCETRGDRLVIGQPGSGKTALLLQLVREGRALFLASDDEARIAEACRDFEPALILVDDAHLAPEKFERLRQIRTDIGADFEIIASTWPGTEYDVTNALGGIGDSCVRRLEGLTRAEILQVLRSIGVSELDDDPYLRLLVDQSANRPGLAVTLGSLWLRGEGREVLTGKALQRSLIPALKRVLEHDPTELLACFALGGDRGMSMEAVSKFLELTLAEVSRKAKLASQGGILSVHRDQLLSVQPEALRSALLEEVFFTPPSLPYRPLLDLVADPGAAVETLAVAAARGANVSRSELRELLQDAGSLRAWQAFALLGESEGLWVLDHVPGGPVRVATQLLESVPQPTIHRLLQNAKDAEGPLHSQPSHPLRVLQDWVQELPDPPEETLRRRQVLVKEAKGYLQRGGDRTTGLNACFLALSPRLESHRMNVTGDAVIPRWGSLPISSVPRMLELWADIREDLGELTPESWAGLEQTLQGWLRPDIRERTEEDTEKYRAVVSQILSDLVDRAQCRPGLLAALKKWTARIDIPFDGPEDEEFDVLFPLMEHLDPGNWRAAQELAGRWASRTPHAVSRQLARYATEARSFGHSESEATWAFFRALADTVSTANEWLASFIEQRLPAGWLRALFERIVREECAGWKQILKFCLETDDYAWLAGYIAICSKSTPQELIEAALAQLPADSVETACSLGVVPLNVLHTLLKHRREEIAEAAAVGEWLSEPKGEVRPSLRVEWREAILRLGSTGGVEPSDRRSTYWPKDILGSDPKLAEAWLDARLNTIAGYEPVMPEGLYAAAIQPLPADRRAELLRRLPAGATGGQLIPLLVGESAEVYRALLSQERLRQQHLVPLAGRPPDDAWAELAKLALEAGHDPRAIAEIAFRATGARSGFGSEHWERWRTAFRRLLETAAKDLQEVARNGLEIADAKIAEAEKRKRRFELTGSWTSALSPES